MAAEPLTVAAGSGEALPAPRRHPRLGQAGRVLLRVGGATVVSLVVLLPLAAVAVHGLQGGLSGLWDAISQPQARSALRFTVECAAIVAVFNAFMGTLIAWVLVRDDFRGRQLVSALVDLPFALPTIVAGVTLLALYGPNSPLGVNIAFTRIGVVVALLFVTLPFVVRSVQPVLLELDPEMEQAAASLGASPFRILRSIILPNLRPAIFAGSALAFGRALGEIGAVALIAGNLPFKTEVASVFLTGQIENDNIDGASAISLVLLLASVLVLFAVAAFDRAEAGRVG